jgi:hypothetical protein
MLVFIMSLGIIADKHMNFSQFIIIVEKHIVLKKTKLVLQADWVLEITFPLCCELASIGSYYS